MTFGSPPVYSADPLLEAALFELRSSISRTVVVVLTCLAAVHSVKAQETSSANQEKKPIAVVNLSLNASVQALKGARDAFLRGGSWADCADACTVSFRMSRPDNRAPTPTIGVRLCRDSVAT